MPAPTLYILAGGGSGGHLCPALAVAHALRAADPDAEVRFLATDRPIDAAILAPAGFPFEPQPVRPFPSPRRPRDLLAFYPAWRASLKQCQRLLQSAHGRPTAVLGLGGFASGPALRTAARLRVPRALLNPDSKPGRANRYAARFAQRIFLQWPTTLANFSRHADRCVVTGCPVRAGFEPLDPDARTAHRRQARTELGLDPHAPVLAIMGGSQGGRNVNDAFLHLLRTHGLDLTGWQIWHQAGHADAPRLADAYARTDLPARVTAFEPRMHLVLHAADLVVARAGASTLAELTAVGVPAILLPYPYHRDQHQRSNAQVLADAGAAEIVTDACDPAATAADLADAFERCLDDATRADMAAAARTLHRPDAAQCVARELMELANSHGGLS